MDESGRSVTELQQALKQIDLLTTLFAGYLATNRRIGKFVRQRRVNSFSLLDIGCGSGKHLRHVHRFALRRGVKIFGVGVDRNPSVVNIAKNESDSTPYNGALTFHVADATALPFEDKTFDLCTASLVLHHLNEDEAITSLREMARVSARVLINDLRPSKLSYFALRGFTRLLPFCEMVRYDGPVSVRKAYSADDIRRLGYSAGVDLEVERTILFRYLADSAPDRTK